MNPPKAGIFTLGCRTNQYDEVIIARNLMDAGFVIVPPDQTADLYVINTCTVTHRADADSRKAARKALRLNPDAFVAVVGCYSQRSPEKIELIDGVDLILGNSEKYNISIHLPSPLAKNKIPSLIIGEPESEKSFGSTVLVPLSRTRALLKIQDGCDQYCTYCIVPHVRGRPRSLPRHDVLSRISELVAIGYREIVLTGIHLGIWGKDAGESLSDLIRAFDDLDGEFRIRLSSIEPMELTDELIELVTSSPRICRHLHIPIQSASDQVLKAMGRPYSVGGLVRVMEKIKKTDSGWNIGTDLIVGFPTETDEDFNEQLANINNLPIDYFHIFTYSRREETPASKLKTVFTQDTVKSRLLLLKEIDRRIREKFLKSQNHRILTFIVEQSRLESSDIITGLSDNYIRAGISSLPDHATIVTGILNVDESLSTTLTITQ
jgi:threonylcarbamoyladenosine tRNA methylthiotransferase MtaB